MSPRPDAASTSAAGPPDGAPGIGARGANGAAPARGAGGDPEEIELKLGVDQIGVVRAVLRRPAAAGMAGFRPSGAVRTITCLDRYFDTADGRLRGAGLRARLREQGGSVVLAVKASISTDGAVSRRVELEGPATRELDPATWEPSDARARVVAALGGAPLVEIAALRQERLQRDFARDGTTVEISLDRMTALRGRRVLDRRVEVEAELLTGDAALLQPLAAALGQLPGVGPAMGSKLAFAVAAREAAVGARTP